MPACSGEREAQGCQRGRGQAREAGEKSGGQSQEFNRDDLEKKEWSAMAAAAGRSREIRLEVPRGWPFKGPL